MSPSARNPATWDEYEGGASPSSGSASSTVLGEETALLSHDHDEPNRRHGLERRQYDNQPFPQTPLSFTALTSSFHGSSSVTNRLAAMADIGGVNSFRSFARSWQRATAFTEVIPRRPSFVYSDTPALSDHPATDDIQYGRSHVDPEAIRRGKGLLAQHLEASPPEAQHGSSATRSGGEPSAGFSSARDSTRDDFRERESKAFDAEMASGALGVTPSSRSSIFASPPHLATPSIIGSYGSYRSSHYGTMPRESIRGRPSLGQPPDWDEDEDEDAAHGEHEPILVKEVKQGDKVILTVEGQSTLPQSVFNSINAIIGVGILSLPLAFKLTGWIIGLVLLTVIASVTGYTAKLLAKCMEVDPSLITYSDLAYVSFGTRARIIVSALFSLELIAACVALVILFADSLDLLLPGLASVNIWKCVCAVVVLALNMLPLRFLSYTSVIGIFSTFCSEFLLPRSYGKVL